MSYVHVHNRVRGRVRGSYRTVARILCKQPEDKRCSQRTRGAVQNHNCEPKHNTVDFGKSIVIEL